MGSVTLDMTLKECRPCRVSRWRRVRNCLLNRFFDMFEGIIEKGKSW